MENALYTYRHHIQFIRDMTQLPIGNHIAGVLVGTSVFNRTEINGGSLVHRIMFSRTVSVGELWLGLLDVIVGGRTEDFTTMDSSSNIVHVELLDTLSSFFSTRDNHKAAREAGCVRKGQTLLDRGREIDDALASALALTLYETVNSSVREQLTLMYLEYATMIRFGTFGVGRNTTPNMNDAFVLDALNPAYFATEVDSVESVCQPGRGSLEKAMQRFWLVVFDNIDKIKAPQAPADSVAKIGSAAMLRESRIRELSDNHTVSSAVRAHAASAIEARHTPSIDIVTSDIPTFEDSEDDAVAPSVLLNADATFCSKSHISMINV